MLRGQARRACTRLSARPAYRRTLLLRTDHAAAIDLVRRYQCDLSCLRGGQDVGIRGQLARREAGVEHDLDLLPERVEAVALDGVEDADEVPTRDQAFTRVAHVDDVDRVVAPQGCDLRVRRKLLEIDREELIVVEGGHVSPGTVRVRGPGGSESPCQNESDHKRAPEHVSLL